MKNVSRPVAPKSDNYDHHFHRPVFFIETGALAYLVHRLQRQKTDIQELLTLSSAARGRTGPAIRVLVELLVDIANAAAQSGSNEYLLAKRLDRILTSSRGEGRTIKDDFAIIADLSESGLLTRLKEVCPDLTPSEIALCGMLTVGLEPACISKILRYDHEQTFYNKRKNIRKKLQLDHAESLEGYLNDLAGRLLQEHDAAFSQLVRRY